MHPPADSRRHARRRDPHAPVRARHDARAGSRSSWRSSRRRRASRAARRSARAEELVCARVPARAAVAARPALRRAAALPRHRHGGVPGGRGAAFARAWAPMAYDGPARALVQALKFRGALPAAGADGARRSRPRSRPSCGRGTVVPVAAAAGPRGAPAASTRRGLLAAGWPAARRCRSRRARPRATAAAPQARAGRRVRSAPAGASRSPASARAAGPGPAGRRRPHDRRDAGRLRARRSGAVPVTAVTYARTL